MNPEKKVKTEILQGLPISPILFLIYISRVFDMVIITSSNTISLWFIDNLGFLVNRKLIHKVAADLKQIEEMVLR